MTHRSVSFEMGIAAMLFTILTIGWLYFLWSRRRFYISAWKMKGPWGYPFLGIVHKLHKLEDILYVFPKMFKDYNKKTVFSWLGPFPVVFTADAKVADIVLQSPDCLNKSSLYKVVEQTAGNGVLTSKVPKWSKHRKFLTPCFGYKVLTRLIPTFNNFARDFCDVLDTCVGCGEVNVKELSVKVALRSSLALSMGVDIEKDADIGVTDSFESLFEIVIYRILRPWLTSKTIYSLSSSYKLYLEGQKCTRDFIRGLLKNRLNVLQNTPFDTNSDKEEEKQKKASPIYIDQAIRSIQENTFTEEDILDDSIIIVIAGYETTSSTLYTVLLFLAMHPQYQERVFDEISTLLDDKERDVTYEDFQSLVYLEMCIKETLRVAPSIPIIARKCEKDLRISEGIIVPAGGEIVIDIFNIQRDEDIWGPSAKEFNPDHFLPSNLNSDQKLAFLPYSKGKRNCVGWQYAGIFLQIMLAQILRKYWFSTTFRYEDMRYKEFISLRYVTTPRLEVHRR